MVISNSGSKYTVFFKIKNKTIQSHTMFISPLQLHIKDVRTLINPPSPAATRRLRAPQSGSPDADKGRQRLCDRDLFLPQPPHALGEFSFSACFTQEVGGPCRSWPHPVQGGKQASEPLQLGRRGCVGRRQGFLLVFLPQSGHSICSCKYTWPRKLLLPHPCTVTPRGLCPAPHSTHHIWTPALNEPHVHCPGPTRGCYTPLGSAWHCTAQTSWEEQAYPNLS